MGSPGNYDPKSCLNSLGPSGELLKKPSGRTSRALSRMSSMRGRSDGGVAQKMCHTKKVSLVLGGVYIYIYTYMSIAKALAPAFFVFFR